MAEAARAHVGGRFRSEVFARDLAEAYELAVRFGSRAATAPDDEWERMTHALRTAGECLGFDCSLDWVTELIDEGAAESFGTSTFRLSP